MEVPSIYKAYFWGLCKWISPQNMAWKMVQYLHFRILKFPLKLGFGRMLGHMKRVFENHLDHPKGTMVLRPLHDPHDCRLDPDWRDHRLQNVHHELRGWLGAGGGAAACVSSSMLSACWWSHIRCGVVAPPICYRQVSQLKPSWFLGRWRSIAVARLYLEDGLAQLPSLRLEAGALQLAHSESQVEASQGNKKQNKVCEASSCQARFEWRWRDGQSPAIGLQPTLSSQFSYPGPPVGLQQIQQNCCEDGPDPGTQDQGCQQPATTATNQHPLQLSSRKLGGVEGRDGFWRKEFLRSSPCCPVWL